MTLIAAPFPTVHLAGEHPNHAGWNEWRLSDPTRFNGAVIGLTLVRLDSPTQARLRIFPQTHLTNLMGMVHGAVVMAACDIAMFAGATVLLDRDLVNGVTLELNTHFVGIGDSQRPLDATTEIVRETGRLVFTRGLVRQEDDIVASWSGILRKPRQP